MILGGAQTWHVNEVSGSIAVAADITYINIIREFFVHQRDLNICCLFCQLQRGNRADLPVSISVETICWSRGKIHP